MAPSTLRVGVDVVSIDDLTDMIETAGPTFLDSCWTPAEQSYSAGSIARLAARWAAKEATMKALGHGIGEIDPVEIEVQAVEGEPPFLRLHGAAAGYAHEMDLSHLALSLTHEAGFAVAFVAACGADLVAPDIILAVRGHGAAVGQLGPYDRISS